MNQSRLNCPSSLASDYFERKCAELEELIRERRAAIRCVKKKNEQIMKEVRRLKLEKTFMTEPPCLVATVLQTLSNRQVLVKINAHERFVVTLETHIKVEQIEVGQRVAIRSCTFAIHRILPNGVDSQVASMLVQKVPDSTFDMVGGLRKQIEQIREVVELPIKHPELFKAIGITPPKGLLLYGPPGTGKTMLVRAVANNTKCAFIRLSGTELVQRYIGEGARLVRELFKLANIHAPSIIFLDEIDSIGSSRTGMIKGDTEVQRTMLELLNQMDGFSPNSRIKVIFATNRIDVLDPALIRPGRMDRKIELPPPDEQVGSYSFLAFTHDSCFFHGREEILKIHSRKMNLNRGVSLKKIATDSAGASGAELKSLCTEAGIMALRESRTYVSQADFEAALRKIRLKVPQQDVSKMAIFK